MSSDLCGGDTFKELINGGEKKALAAHLKGCQEPPVTPLITSCWHLSPCRKCFSIRWLKTNLCFNTTLEQIFGTWKLTVLRDRLLLYRRYKTEHTSRGISSVLFMQPQKLLLAAQHMLALELLCGAGSGWMALIQHRISEESS